jgi:hypothetical protein
LQNKKVCSKVRGSGGCTKQDLLAFSIIALNALHRVLWARKYNFVKKFLVKSDIPHSQREFIAL